ncbi:hypothetical protein MBAV_002760 [Candidatus Magnetobacterium bavaricum]|uniref:Uncharacterized protein n=1 Tax=Candidatus Magnetobacterium bavaricum TaxID=29290 RepID=A0A0F3GSX6_9BACT|nr:hypothetical protein MBAV_002760 [Candidatus Magnetobacterium bavaricum]
MIKNVDTTKDTTDDKHEAEDNTKNIGDFAIEMKDLYLDLQGKGIISREKSFFDFVKDIDAKFHREGGMIRHSVAKKLVAWYLNALCPVRGEA